jgi:hypothetical protein
MPAVPVFTDALYENVITDICDLDWPSLCTEDLIAVAWAYYFFSVQFRENLLIARTIHPQDQSLQDLEAEECNTDNLSPWPGVALPAEKMDHDEFMKRVLSLAPIDEHKRHAFETAGHRYLTIIRAMNHTQRALSITSYEDGGLERVFRAMLTAPPHANPLLDGFRHFLSEHIKFDSDPSQGHGAMIRHLTPDDRILPLWLGFKQLLLEFAPALSRP